MKKKVFYLLLCCFFLISGCGIESEQTEQETSAITEVFVTEETAPAPTVPETFFQQYGLSLWEGTQAEVDPKIRETRGSFLVPGCSEVVFYEKAKPVEKIVYRELLDAEVQLHINEFSSEEFGKENIAQIISKFWELAHKDDPELTKEAWETQYKGYKLLHYWMTIHTPASEAIERFSLEHENFTDYSIRNVSAVEAIMDKYTGKVYPSSGKIIHNTGDSEMVFWSILDTFSSFSDSENSVYPDVKALSERYVLVPEGYDGLVYMFSAYKDLIPEEERLDQMNRTEGEEETTVQPVDYAEYIKEHEHLRYFYVAHESGKNQEDQREAANYTTLDRLGINYSEEFIFKTNAEGIETASTRFDFGGKLRFFNSEIKSAQSYTESVVVPTIVDVKIKEYTSDEFSLIPRVLGEFYNADLQLQPGISMQQWLKEHENHKLISFVTKKNILTSGPVTDYCKKNSGKNWWTVFYGSDRIIDKYSGESFTPRSASIDLVENFSAYDGSVNFSALYRRNSEWTQAIGRDYKNLSVNSTIFVLVPKDYDGLIFTTELYNGTKTDEEVRAEYSSTSNTTSSNTTSSNTTLSTDTNNKSTWGQGKFTFEGNQIKRYYFDPTA